MTLADAEDALGTRALRYGEDDHYDVISAFIKSIRGSDPDAGLYWLARMLEAGEDARFIARRLVILASEDVGMADPMALVVADAAARAVEFVGLPEAQLNLAQAVVHLATAPKSNRAALGIWTAREDVQAGTGGEVPAHLRDAHYRGAKGLGHGKGYEYPHDDPRGWVPQQYGPADVADRRYYEPSPHGFEQEVAERMNDREAEGQSDDRGRHDRGDAMTAGELAIVLGTVFCTLGFAALIVTLVRVLQTLRELRRGRRPHGGRDRPAPGRDAGLDRGRPATTSTASTTCSARPRRSRRRCRARPASPGWRCRRR